MFCFSDASFKMPEPQQHNTTRWDGPMYPHYSTKSSRMQSFQNWPASSSQSAENLSEAGFFYSGKALQNKILLITGNNLFCNNN
jgi:hypothetical protein